MNDNNSSIKNTIERDSPTTNLSQSHYSLSTIIIIIKFFFFLVMAIAYDKTREGKLRSKQNIQQQMVVFYIPDSDNDMIMMMTTM